MPAVDSLLSFEDEQITLMSKSLSSQSWLVVTGRFANWFTVQIVISVILLQIISLMNQSKEASQSSIDIHVKNAQLHRRNKRVYSLLRKLFGSL